jgi:hypothetical protein
MACELEEAFDRAKSLLPDGWLLTSFTQDSAGWLVQASKSFNGMSVGARAGNLTKALNRLADKLEQRNEV